MEISQEIVEKIKNLPKPAIVAISGFGGAGKSTTAEMLGKMLDASVVGVDSFATDRLDINHSLWGSVDFKRLEQEVFIPFVEGQNLITYGHYDWNVNGIGKTMSVNHNGLLIVEGIGLFRPELLKYFSYKIWIDTPMDEAIRRGKKRDREVHKNPQDEKWDGVWKRNDTEYFETYKPKEQADVVIDNI